MNLLQLEGEVDNRDQEIAILRKKLQQMDDALSYERIKNQAIESGIRELRSITMPLLRGLQKIHGLVDEMGLQEQSSIGSNDKWEAIKKRNPGRIAEAIDILLIHGTMNTNQLKAAMKMNYENCRVNVVNKLASMGLIIRNGRDFSLKQL